MSSPQYPVDPRVATVQDVRLIGGSPCVDFVNTVLWRGTEREQDVLCGYADLLTWVCRLQLLPPDLAAELGDLSTQSPDEASRTHRRAIRFREALHRILVARVDGSEAATADLKIIKSAFAGSVADASLVQSGDAVRWEWRQGAGGLDRPLWPVAHHALALLLDPIPGIRRCGAEECGWLFIDHSKNKSRRWCSMEGCGSRVKMRRHYARARADRDSGPPS
jgi:predicted RNA-binding Zn ribbon-like protein